MEVCCCFDPWEKFIYLDWDLYGSGAKMTRNGRQQSDYLKLQSDGFDWEVEPIGYLRVDGVFNVADATLPSIRIVFRQFR